MNTNINSKYLSIKFEKLNVIGIGMISANPADQGSWSWPRETLNLASLSDYDDDDDDGGDDDDGLDDGLKCLPAVCLLLQSETPNLGLPPSQCWDLDDNDYDDWWLVLIF